jgi:hypothetical protein
MRAEAGRVQFREQLEELRGRCVSRRLIKSRNFSRSLSV